MVKTAIENSQNLIVEGCYIPFDWQKDFQEPYLSQINYTCLIFSEDYIHKHYREILEYSDVIEKRLDDGYCTQELLLRENRNNLAMCKKYDLHYLLIDGRYEVPVQIPSHDI